MGGKKTVESNRRFEKDRRDKLNVAFMDLCKLLPDYEPSKTITKIDILKKAAECIIDFQSQKQEVMNTGKDVVSQNEILKLKKRVSQLLIKIKELMDALRSANVPIPNFKCKKKKVKAIDVSTMNKISDIKKKDEYASKDTSTTIKKVKCGCMKLTPEKKPLKESNPAVDIPSTLGNISTITCGSSITPISLSNHSKSFTITPSHQANTSVLENRIHSNPVIRHILPNANISSVCTPPTVDKITSLLSDLNNSSEVNCKQNSVNSIVTSSTFKTIPIMSNDIQSSNILKEISPVSITRKAVNIVTTSISNSLSTQTAIKTTQVLSLSQSGIITSPVISSTIQTVPVIEKNILSNLCLGTLIIADGRIMNVPPIVPQILVKPPPTVILMSSIKKKEKIIIPKKRDVTKTTFSNKTPIPAIQSFRLESCPKMRPKKKPKAKTEKCMNKEISSDSKCSKKKKRKLDVSSVSSIESKKVKLNSSSVDLNISHIHSLTESTIIDENIMSENMNELDCNNEMPNSNILTPNNENILRTPSLESQTEVVENTESSKISNILECTVSSSSNQLTSKSKIHSSQKNDLNIKKTELSLLNTDIDPEIVPGISETTNQLTNTSQNNDGDSYKEKDTNKESRVHEVILPESNALNISETENELAMKMIDSPQTFSSKNIDNKIITNCEDLDKTVKNSVSDCNSLNCNYGNAADFEKNSSKNDCSDSVPVCSITTTFSTTNYLTLPETLNHSELRTTATEQTSLFVVGNEKVAESISSSFNEQNDYTLSNRSNNCFQHELVQNESLLSNVGLQKEIPAETKSGAIENVDILENQEKIPLLQSSSTVESTNVSLLKPTLDTTSVHREIISDQVLIRNDLPDLGSNALVENVAMFSHASELKHSMSSVRLEKSVFSLQGSEPSVNPKISCTIVSAASRTVNKNQISSANSYHQQQTITSQMNPSLRNRITSRTNQPMTLVDSDLNKEASDNYLQNNLLIEYTKPSNHPTYTGIPGPILSDVNSSTNNVQSINLNSTDNLSYKNTFPSMTSANPVLSSDNEIHSLTTSANFYPVTSTVRSQNSLTVSSSNKVSDSLPDKLSKQILPCRSFNNSVPSVTISDRISYNQNASFHRSPLVKSSWEKSVTNKKELHGSLDNSSQSDIRTKEKNVSQFDRMAGLDKQNEAQVHSQMMYLGFQNDTPTSHASGFFQNVTSTSAIIQNTYNFNDVSTGTGIYNESLSRINHNENILTGNSGQVSPEKAVSKSQNRNAKNSPSSNDDKDLRNVSLYPSSSQSLETVGYNTFTSNRLSELQTNNLETNLPSKSNESHIHLACNNFPGEPKNSRLENHPAIVLNSNTIQSTISQNSYNTISMGAFVESNSKVNSLNQITTVEERRKISNVSLEKELSKTNRFSKSMRLITCNSTDSSKNNSLYSSNMLEKENVVSTSSKTTNGISETGRSSETGNYNFPPKNLTHGKSILGNPTNNSDIEKVSKINESTENLQTSYKGYSTNSSNIESEKASQERHKIIPSTTKSVSTEINADDFRTSDFNRSFQKSLQHQGTPFASNSSSIPHSSVKTNSFNSFDSSMPFSSQTPNYSHYNNENTRHMNTCSNPKVIQPNQLLEPSISVAVITPHSTSKNAAVAVTSNISVEKDAHDSRMCQPTNDETSYKGDINAEFLKTKDLERNTFIPIIDDVRLTTDFSSDLFSSFQVPTGGQHSESISPTAAFLLAFPLVSTSRNIDNIADNENHDNQTSTPTTILQIGNIEPPNTEIFQSIEFQKNNKSNNQYNLNSDYIHVNDIQNKQSSAYNNKTCEKRKDVFPDFSKEHRNLESKSKPKSNSTNNSYNTQSYNYSNFNDYQQYCDKEGSQWQQEFSSVPKEQKKTFDKKKDKGMQKGCLYQSCQDYYSYLKDIKRKQQNRISVNWMSTSENREQNEYQPKDSEVTNNYSSHSSQPVYNNMPLDFQTETFSEFCNSKKTNNYSWSPNKSLLPSLDNHLMIPSTLPTLVGDLALGTSTPSESYKTFESQKTQCNHGQIIKKGSEKMDDGKKRNEFPKSQTNFLSVSQLVDPKSKKQKTAERNYKRQDKTSKSRNFNCSKRKDDTCMYFEDRNNFLPNQNQYNEKRHAYKGGSYSAESLIGAQQNEIDFSSNFNYQQNSNYFQSDFGAPLDSSQQYGYIQQTQFTTGYTHDEYQDYGFGTNQRNPDQNRTKTVGRKEDNFQGVGLMQPQIYPSYSKSANYNLPSSQLNTNTTTTLTNFNLSAIFPEMNDQRVASSGQNAQQMSSTFASSQAYRGHLLQ